MGVCPRLCWMEERGTAVAVSVPTPLCFPQAAGDARRLMGSRRYYDLMLSDACHHHQLKFTDEMDVTTVKEYMQVCMCVCVRVCIHVCACMHACEVV